VSSNLVFNDKATESVAKIDLGKSTRRIDVRKGQMKKKLNLHFSHRSLDLGKSLINSATVGNVTKYHFLLPIIVKDEIKNWEYKYRFYFEWFAKTLKSFVAKMQKCYAQTAWCDLSLNYRIIMQINITGQDHLFLILIFQGIVLNFVLFF